MKKEMTTIKQTRLHSILDEATKLLIEKPNASMNEIAESAKIGIATLHRYVESREQAHGISRITRNRGGQ